MIDWASFTPISLLGGMLIGLASVMLWWFNGRIAGVSGIVASLLSANTGQLTWQWAFVLGLVASPWLYQIFADLPPIRLSTSPMLYIVAGLLVGFGTRLGSGCTSGHGICGNARLSKRSFAATLSFMLFGFLTVYIGRHVLGLL